ncbi:MAG: adenine phosphoribosyltransferase [Acidimicrobiales bacterium]
MAAALQAWELVRDIADFPSPGVVFKDITPLLADADAFSATVEALACRFADRQVDYVLGIEARGFIVAAPVALSLRAGFVPARKSGKLPWHVVSEPYTLEYGDSSLEVHADAMAPGTSVVIVDDVLATGGTACAAIKLVERLGARVAGLGFVLELGFLDGRARLSGHEVFALHGYR